MENNTRPTVKIRETRTIEMEEIRHFDDTAISIAPSLLKNKLATFQKERDVFYEMGRSIGAALSALFLNISVQSYNDFLGIGGDVWQAVVMGAFLTFALRFLYLAVHFLLTARRRPPSPDDFVDSLLSKQ